MVECSRLIVDDYQIRVDGYFLNFKVIPIGKLINSYEPQTARKDNRDSE
jgi:hypothetical protein